MSRLKMIRLTSVHWHRFFGWAGAGLLLIYIISALTHPLMSWTGPKAARFFPPKAAVDSQHLQAVGDIIRQQQLSQAQVIKVTPAENGPLLQITTDNLAPRRYFDLTSGEELLEYDQSHAIWLGRYYLGDQEAAVKKVTKQDYFDRNYPWVNRLLPVYKIEFDTPDNKVLYIYTELGAMAGISNDYKRRLQSVFQWLHTWSFMDGNDNARVVLLSVFMLTLTAFIITGIALVFTFKSRKIIDAKRRWHRRIAYIIWLPLLGLSSSGFYHLLQSAYGENTSGLKIIQQLSLEDFYSDAEAREFQLNQDQLQGLAAINQVSVVNHSDGTLLFRAGIATNQRNGSGAQPAGEHSHHQSKPVSREQRYTGLPSEKGAIYFDPISGQSVPWNDQQAVRTMAADYLNAEPEAISGSQLITRFGPDYDFRNKRLPVWKVSFNNSNQDRVFVDPITGIIVDHTTQTMRYERLSFSLLHKWNFFVPIMGRQNRDILVVAILSITLLATVFGIGMQLQRRKRRHKPYISQDITTTIKTS